MKRITLAAVAYAVLGLLTTWVTPAGATPGDDHGPGPDHGRPYCSAQVRELPHPEHEQVDLDAAPVEPALVPVPEHGDDHGDHGRRRRPCRQIPPATMTDHQCGFRGYVTIPEHVAPQLDYLIDGASVEAGNHPQALGATVHVTAEVKHDGNDVPDYHAVFQFSTPNCTPPPGPPGAPGAPGAPGQPGAPGAPGAPSPVVIIREPAPARPVVASPSTTG